MSGSTGLVRGTATGEAPDNTLVSLALPRQEGRGRTLLRINATATGSLEIDFGAEEEGRRRITFKQGVNCWPLEGHSSSELQVRHGPDVRSVEIVEVPPVAVRAEQPFAYPVVCGMASIPSRVDVLRVAVDSILPQVDHLFVYLNGFDWVPGFLASEKITVFRSSQYGDYRDNSKYFGLRCLEEEGYFFSIDDDIEYPSDYVSEMVAAIERYDRSAIVGVHGVIYGAGSRLFLDRAVLHFRNPLEADVPVSALGTGTTAFHTSALSFDCLEFKQVGMADLVTAQAASRHGVPMIAVARGPGWLQGLEIPASSQNLYAESIVLDSAHDVFIRRGGVPAPSAILRAVQAEPAVWTALDPEAKVFLEFLVTLESGHDSALVAVPPGQLVDHLAERLRWPALALAAARGVLIGCWPTRKVLARATAPVREATLGVSAPLLEELMGLVDDYVQTIRVPDDAASYPTVDAAAEAQALATARTYGDAALVLGLTVAGLVAAGSPKALLQLYPALRRAGQLGLAEKVYAALGRLAPEVATEALLERAAFQLDMGEVEDVLAEAPRLMDAGDLGRQLVAFAGMRSGKSWTEDVVYSTFSRATNGRRIRLARTMAKALAREALPTCSPEIWADGMPHMQPEVRRLAATVLLANGTWSERIPFESLGIEDDVETVLWRAATRAALSGLSLREAQHAVNSVFIAGGLLPIEVTGEGGTGFFNALVAEPLAPFRDSSAPLVSVIMAAFDSQDTIDYALRSVLAQSYPNIEVIIVDDCSAVPLRLPEWAQSRPDVTLRRLDRNCGPYECRNVALEMAKGEFIATQDADDWMHPQKIERQVRALMTSNAVVSYNRHIRLLATGAPALENNGQFMGDGPITSMFRRPVFEAIGPFMPVRTRGDMEFKSRVVNRYRRARVLHDDAVTLLALDSPLSNSKVFTQSALDFINIGKFKRWYSIEQPVAYFRSTPVHPVGLGRLFDTSGKSP